MKNKKKLLVFFGIFVIVVGLISIYILDNKSNSYKMANGLVKVELKPDLRYDIDLEHPKVFNSYADFSLYFDSKNINEADFNNSNYAVIILSYDECSYTNVVPTKYVIKGKNINVTAYHDGCSTCKPLYAYYAVKVNKNITELNQNTKSIARNKNKCN